MAQLQLRKLSHYNERKDQLIARYSRCEKAIEDPTIRLGFYKLRKYDEINYEAHFLRTKIDLTKEKISPLDIQMLKLFEEYERRIEKSLPIIAILGETPDLAIVRRELVENAREAAKVAMLIKLLADRERAQSIASNTKLRSSPVGLNATTNVTGTQSKSILASPSDSNSGIIKKKATRGRPRNSLKVKPFKTNGRRKSDSSSHQSSAMSSLEASSSSASDLVTTTSVCQPDEPHLFVTVKIKRTSNSNKELGRATTSSDLLGQLCGLDTSSDASKFRLLAASQTSPLSVALVTQNKVDDEKNSSAPIVPIVATNTTQQPIVPVSKLPALRVLNNQSVPQQGIDTQPTFAPSVHIVLSPSISNSTGLASLGSTITGNAHLGVHSPGSYGVDDFQSPLLSQPADVKPTSSGLNPLRQANSVFEQPSGASRLFPVLDAVHMNLPSISTQLKPSINPNFPTNTSNVSPSQGSLDSALVVASSTRSKTVNTPKKTVSGDGSSQLNGHQPIEPKGQKRKADFEDDGSHPFARVRISAPLRSFDLLEKWSPVYVRTVFEAADRSNVAENKRNYVQQMYDERFNVSITKRQANYLLLHYGLRFSSPSPLEFNPLMDEIQSQYPEDIERIRQEVKRRTGFHLSAYDAESAIQMRRLFYKIYGLYTEPEENYAAYFEKYSRIMPRRPYATIVAYNQLDQSESEDRTPPSNPSSPITPTKDDTSSNSINSILNVQSLTANTPTTSGSKSTHSSVETSVKVENAPRRVSSDEVLNDNDLQLRIRNIFQVSSGEDPNRIEEVRETLLRDSNVILEVEQIKTSLSAMGLLMRPKLNGINANVLKNVPNYFSTSNLVLNGDTTKSHSIWLINNKKKGTTLLPHLDFKLRGMHGTASQFATTNVAKSAPVVPTLSQGFSNPVSYQSDRPLILSPAQSSGSSSETIPSIAHKPSSPQNESIVGTGIQKQQHLDSSPRKSKNMTTAGNLTKTSPSIQPLNLAMGEPVVTLQVNTDASPSRRFYNKTTSSPPITNLPSPTQAKGHDFSKGMASHAYAMQYNSNGPIQSKTPDETMAIGNPRPQ